MQPATPPFLDGSEDAVVMAAVAALAEQPYWSMHPMLHLRCVLWVWGLCVMTIARQWWCIGSAAAGVLSVVWVDRCVTCVDCSPPTYASLIHAVLVPLLSLTAPCITPRLLLVLINGALEGPYLRGELDRRTLQLKDIASRRKAFLTEVCAACCCMWCVCTQCTS